MWQLSVAFVFECLLFKPRQRWSPYLGKYKNNLLYSKVPIPHPFNTTWSLSERYGQTNECANNLMSKMGCLYFHLFLCTYVNLKYICPLFKYFHKVSCILVYFCILLLTRETLNLLRGNISHDKFHVLIKLLTIIEKGGKGGRGQK